MKSVTLCCFLLLSVQVSVVAANALPDGDVDDLVAGEGCTNATAVRVWADDRWGVYGPAVQPGARDTELMSLDFSGPVGSRAITSFRVTNRTDGNALYSIRATAEGDESFAAALRFREVGFIELNNGTIQPDPIFELPIGEVLRIAPHQTAVVWVDVDTSGLAPGNHSASVALVPGYANIPAKTLSINLHVSQMDVRAVDMPVWTYVVRSVSDICLLTPDYGFNTSCLLPTWYVPKPKVNGQLDFREVDAIIGAFVANGVPRDRIRLMLYAMLPAWGGLENADGTVLPYRSAGWREEYVRRVRAFLDHVRSAHGIGTDRIYFAVNDEPDGDPDDPSTSAWHAFYGADLAHEIDPTLKAFANPWKLGDSALDLYLGKFDVLEPFLRPIVEGQVADDIPRRFKASGKELWSYTIYLKENTPRQYRRLWWAHLDYGFDGPATFYDLFDHSGDSFNSHDGKTNALADYNAVYANARRTALVPSRRLEAWYLGLVDFLTARVCRDQIAAAKVRGVDVREFERSVADLVRSGNAAPEKMDFLSARLLALSSAVNAAQATDWFCAPFAPYTTWERNEFWNTCEYNGRQPRSSSGVCSVAIDSVVRTSAASEPVETTRDPVLGMMIMISRMEEAGPFGSP